MTPAHPDPAKEKCSSFILFNGAADETPCIWPKGHIGCHSPDTKKIEVMKAVVRLIQVVEETTCICTYQRRPECKHCEAKSVMHDALDRLKEGGAGK